MDADIDDVCLGTNTQQDHLILLGEFFVVCKEKHTGLRLGMYEFMQETMQYLGFDIGYGWSAPAIAKAKHLMGVKVRHEDPKKGLHDVCSFIGACNVYRRHIKKFTYTSAILTDLIKKSTSWLCALMSNKHLTTSGTKWPTLNAWECLRHRVKLTWLLTAAMWPEAERFSSGKH